MTTTGTEGLLRELAPQVLGVVVRRHGDFASAEDAVQEALIAAATQWPAEGQPDNPLGWLVRVASLYGLLERMTPNPMVTLNRAVAVAMASGPDAGLAVLDDLGDALGDHHRLHAVRGHLLELAGDPAGAVVRLRAAAARTDNLREQRYLTAQAARLGAV